MMERYYKLKYKLARKMAGFNFVRGTKIKHRAKDMRVVGSSICLRFFGRYFEI